MLGSFLSRLLIMAFGYAYPAYKCYKVVEMNKPDIEKLRFWCQYWILVAVLTIIERFGDMFISWLPFYHEVKLGFFIYLWHPKTTGTLSIYDGIIQPYVSQHEADIDQKLLELRTRATDTLVVFWQQSATYGQARFFEILQYFATQSYALRSRPPKGRQQEQEQQQERSQPPPIIPTRQPRQQEQQNLQQEQLSNSVQQQEEHPERIRQSRRMQRSSRGVQIQENLSSNPPKIRSSDATLGDAHHASVPTKTHVGTMDTESISDSESSDQEAMYTDSSAFPENEDSNLNQKEVMMEDTIAVTRARLRRNISRTAADQTSAF